MDIIKNKTNKEFSSENLLKFYSNMNINNNVNQKKIHISQIKGIIFPLSFRHFYKMSV